MPHINIISWPISDDEKAKKLLEEITVATHKILGCPIDKISISLQEVSPSRWSDAGVIGTDPNFLTKSRAYISKDSEHDANKK